MAARKGMDAEEHEEKERGRPMKFKMTKGMHAKRILCLGLAAAMALTSVQISPVTVEAAQSKGSVATVGENETAYKIELNEKYNALEAVYGLDVFTKVNEETGERELTVDQIKEIAFTASNSGEKAAKLKVKIYMKKHDSLSGFVQVDPEDVVYTGTIEIPAKSTDEKVEIKLSKKFDLAGASMLLAMETEVVEGTGVSIKTSGQSGAFTAKDDKKAVDLTRIYTSGEVSASTPGVAVEGEDAGYPTLDIVAHKHSFTNCEAKVSFDDGKYVDTKKYVVCKDASDVDRCYDVYDEDKTTPTTEDEMYFEAYRNATIKKIVGMTDDVLQKVTGDEYTKVSAAKTKAVGDATVTKTDANKEGVITTTVKGEIQKYTYVKVDEKGQTVTLADNKKKIDEIFDEFKNAVASEEDKAVERKFHEGVVALTDVIATNPENGEKVVVNLYNTYIGMTASQKALVRSADAEKIKVASKLNSRYEAWLSAVDGIVTLGNTTSKDVFKDATKVAAVDKAVALEKEIEEIKKDVDELNKSLLPSEKLDYTTVNDFILGKTVYQNAKDVCEAISLINAIKAPINLASGKAVKDAHAKIYVQELDTQSDFTFEQYGYDYRNGFLAGFVYNLAEYKKLAEEYRKQAHDASDRVVDFIDAVNAIPDDYKAGWDADSKELENYNKIRCAEDKFGLMLFDDADIVKKDYAAILEKYRLAVNVKAAVVAIRAIPGVPTSLTEGIQANDTSVDAALTAVNKAGVKAHVAASELELLEDNEAAWNVIKQIKAIGTVTASSEAQIAAAEKALAELDAFDEAEAKKHADNNSYVARVRGGRVAYDYKATGADGKVTHTPYSHRKTLKDARDTFAGLNVVQLIKEIGTVDESDACWARIKKAEDAYAALTDDQKKLVSNNDVLVEASARYIKLAADKIAANKVIENYIDKIQTPITGKSAIAVVNAYNAIAGGKVYYEDEIVKKYGKDAVVTIDKDASGEYTVKVKVNGNTNTVPLYYTTTEGKTVELRSEAPALTEAQQAYIPTEKFNLVVNAVNAWFVINKIEEIENKTKSGYTLTDLKNDIDGTFDTDGKKTRPGIRDEYSELSAGEKAVLVANPFETIDAALDVEKKIDAIGDVTAITLDSKTTIRIAQEAYDNYEAAKKTVKIDAGKANDLKVAVEKLQKVIVADVVEKVKAIGKVEYTSECAKKIQAAQAAFNNLTIEEKAAFANDYKEEYKTFEDAVSTYDLKAAAAVDAKIAALPVASLETEAEINAVYKEFDALTVNQKAKVLNAATLMAKINAINELKAEKADKDAADAVAKLIDAIGTVDGSEEADKKIAAAQEAFYSLTATQRNLIADKKVVLETAVQEQAKKKAEISSAAEDAKAVAAAKEAIAAIGEVTAADEATKAKITAAQIAFYGLREELRATLIDEKATLDAAYDKYTELYIQNKLNEVTPVAPTETPTVAPTDVPTAAPTETPTEAPTKAPTKKPTAAPTKKPSVKAPAKVTNVKAVNQKGKKVAVSWKKLPKVAGYQVQISTSKKFTKSTTKTYGIKKYTTVKKTVSKLSLKKKYYVRVRAYNKSGKTMKYGKYSLVKSVTVKK